ncbi:MAG: FHA domain-containing protein [Actinobacteria bacterium]|nr:FHA domain-containing protein [Actinomycetota bacterium]
MTDDRDPAADGPKPEVEVEVETDPTVVYIPIADREGRPMTPEEAGDVGGLEGYALVVSRGPSTGVTYLLKEGNTTVGRHPESDIFLNDVTVSRQHCRLVAGPDSLLLEDSGSTNGTYVNDERVDETQLEAGDEVLIGRFHFLVAHGDA